MQKLARHSLVGLALAVVLSSSSATDKSVVPQAELDRACQAARAAALASIRAGYVEECVAKGVKDRPACVRFYADWGDTIKPAGKKFYDLPACVRAFESRRGERHAD